MQTEFRRDAIGSLNCFKVTNHARMRKKNMSKVRESCQGYRDRVAMSGKYKEQLEMGNPVS